MARFVIGDNHFGDPRILRYCRNELFSTVDEMNKFMTKQWNDTVKNKDLVFINGDLSRYTNEGETVLDFTMGSGTTGVACINTNRNFIGIELDEGYFKIAQNRIEEAKKNIKFSLKN